MNRAPTRGADDRAGADQRRFVCNDKKRQRGCRTPHGSGAFQTKDGAQSFLIGAGTGEIIEGGFGGFDDVALDEGCAFARSLFVAFDAALPFENGPAWKIVLREFGEDRSKIDLAIA